jgi:glycerophosphoryl diester phosphodiesterase
MVGAMSFFSGQSPLVIAHRGLATDHQENTLPAFQAALDAGADIIEIDVHLSKDGQVVISHDSSLKRLTGRDGHVRDFSADQLRDLDLGSGIGFSTLSEAFDTFPTTRFNIDLKTPEVVPAFVDTVIQHRATHRVLAASFNEKTRSQAVAGLAGVATSASQRHFLPALLCSGLGRGRCLANIFREIDAVQAPLWVRGIPVATPRFIRQLVDLGKQVHVWTINDPEQMVALYRRGVTGIVTDRTDLAVQVRSEFLAGEGP